MKRFTKVLAFSMILLLGCAFVIPAQMGSLDAHAASKIKLNKTKATMVIGKTLQLKVKGTKKKATWSSSKKSVATVSKKGKITAKKKGIATITAKVGKKKYTCKVSVYPNYKKMIVGIWAGHYQGEDYIEWDFRSDGTFDYIYYYNVFEDDPSVLSGTYKISGNKLHIKSGNLKSTYTIKELKKDTSLIIKNSTITYKLYPSHV